jgi:uncharacterized protein
MPIDLRPMVAIILDDYALSVDGDHGVAHWARVLENGMQLSRETGANHEIVRLFAILHDARRINEISDPRHGQRAADYAVKLRGRFFELSDADFSLLYQACAGHTCERTHPDVSVQTCFDADRLDLGRVGVMPDPSRLCTPAAKTKALLQWADGRACFRVIPQLIAEEWGVNCKEEGRKTLR